MVPAKGTREKGGGVHCSSPEKMKKNSFKPIIAVSGCLLGEEIRYDGNHKRHPFLEHELKIFRDLINDKKEKGR